MTTSKEEFENTIKPLVNKLVHYATTEGKQYGISDVKISVAQETEKTFSVESEETSITGGSDYGVTITLYAGDKKISFNQNTLDKKTLEDAINQNMQVIHLVPDNKAEALLESEKVYDGEEVDLDLYDNNPPSDQELMEYAQKMSEVASAEEGVKTVKDTEVSQSEKHVFVFATNGYQRSNSTTSYSVYTYPIAEDAEGNMEGGYDHHQSRHFSDMPDPEEVGKNAAEEARSKLNSTLPDTADMPIVISPDAASSFFSIVFSAIDGTAVHRDATFLKGKVGQQVMSSEITIEDDPLISKGLASQYVDSAGQKTKKMTFIKDGVLESYNVSLAESRYLGIDSIGRNSGTTNKTVKPGTKTPEQLMADIKEGVYIKGFHGGRVDVNTGDHSRQAHGVMIRDGKLTNETVSGFIVAGKLQDMFMKVSVANDTPSLPSTKTSFATPTTRIDGVTIAGKKKDDKPQV